MKKLIIFVSLISILFTGCSKNTTTNVNKGNNSKSTVKQNKDSNDKKEIALDNEKSNLSSNSNNYDSQNKKTYNYDLSITEYNYNESGKSISIKYPQIVNSTDNNYSDKINSILKNSALNIIDKYKNIDKYTLTINCNITLENSNILSIQYTGLFTSVESYIPQNIFYTTNIDILSKKELTTNDILNIDNNLLNTLKTKGVIINSTGDLKAAQEDELKSLQFDNFINSIEGIYLTSSDIVFSIEVLHAIGDHMEIQVPYSNIKTNIKQDNIINSIYRN